MYYYNGIETNNLKNISVNFDDHDLIYITGISGSGKSSLAFDTISAISENEYNSLIKDNKINLNYKIKEYGKVLVSATLKQLNFNVNPRSTILTYFGLYWHIAYILSYFTKLSLNCFSLNGIHRCKECNGIGYINKIDEILVIDSYKTLKQNPFKCWNGIHNDFFKQLLHNFCIDNNINENVRINDLSKKNRELILNSKSIKKYKISYIGGGRKRVKTSEYIGPILGLKTKNDIFFSNNNKKFSKFCICPNCNGCRIESDISDLKILDYYNIKKILISPLFDIKPLFISIKKKYKNEILLHSCESIINFINACEKLNVSYLNFSRSICTLSGGELQRLRMAQLLIGKINNLLIVLDEPTSSLDINEVSNIINIISELKRNNTIIVVDHNNNILDIANKSYFLGPKSGTQGGQLISKADYLNLQNSDLLIPIRKQTKEISVFLKSDYIRFKDNYKIKINSLNCISGVSGIGKSTILRDILPYQIVGYKYITQKPIKGNRNSTVATFTGIFEEIQSYYSKKLKKDKKLFSNISMGACKKCGGKGQISIGELYDEEIYETCEQCNGTGYLKTVLSLTINDKNIYDFMNQSIDDIIDSNIYISKKFENKINILHKLGLGHLFLNQKIKTLSGGENQRIKLSQSMHDGKYKIFGLDEPTKGLGKKEIVDLINVIYDNIENYNKTYIVAEHDNFFIKMSQYVNILKKDRDGNVIIKDETI